MSVAVAKTLAYGTPIVGGSLGTTYGVTRETVEYSLNKDGYKLEDIADSAWEEIFKKFKEKDDQKDLDFKDLKNDSSKTKDDLKKLCRDKFNTVYKSAFHGNDQVKEETKRFCLSQF